MREAAVVSTARTPIGKAYRGAFNATQTPTLGGHAIARAVKRAGVDAGEIDDVVMGTAIQMGTAFQNPVRQCLVRAAPPVTVAGQCASGMTVTVGGGVESISMNQTNDMFATPDPWLLENAPSIYMGWGSVTRMIALVGAAIGKRN